MAAPTDPTARGGGPPAIAGELSAGVTGAGELSAGVTVAGEPVAGAAGAAGPVPRDRARKPMLVVVSGRPGSGKTTLAPLLARALSVPLVSRDEINEGIYHTFDHDPELASRDQVARLTFDVYFRTIELFVSSGVTFVAEAAFQDFRWRPRLEPLLPYADIRIVQCVVDPELAHRRYVSRRTAERDERRSRREPLDPALTRDASPALRPFQPVSLPVPSIRVATADGYDPPLDEIVAFLTAPAAG